MLIDQSDRARIRLTGTDRAAFLHNMVTAEVKKLTPGEGRSAAIVNQRGGLLDWGAVYAGEDAHWWIGGAGRGPEIMAWLDRYLISEDVQLEDLSGDTALVYTEDLPALQGLADFGHAQATVNGVTAHAFVTYGLQGKGFQLLVAQADLGAIGEALGADPVDAELLRLQQGLPLVGAEVTDARNPWEARLDASVALDKGCYLGQEIVARLNAYDKVQRYLVGLRFAGDTPPAGAELLGTDGQLVGKVTSAKGTLGLGYVKAMSAVAGQQLVCKNGNLETLATLEDRPFWAGKTRAVSFAGKQA